ELLGALLGTERAHERELTRLAYPLTEALELGDRHHVEALDIAEGERLVGGLGLLSTRESAADHRDQQLSRTGVGRERGSEGTIVRRSDGGLPRSGGNQARRCQHADRDSGDHSMFPDHRCLLGGLSSWWRTGSAWDRR